MRYLCYSKLHHKMVGKYYIYEIDNDKVHRVSWKKMCQVLGYRNKYDNSSQWAAPGVPGFLRNRFIKFNDESTENLFDAIQKEKKRFDSLMIKSVRNRRQNHHLLDVICFRF